MQSTLIETLYFSDDFDAALAAWILAANLSDIDGLAVAATEDMEHRDGPGFPSAVALIHGACEAEGIGANTWIVTEDEPLVDGCAQHETLIAGAAVLQDRMCGGKVIVRLVDTPGTWSREEYDGSDSVNGHTPVFVAPVGEFWCRVEIRLALGFSLAEHVVGRGTAQAAAAITEAAAACARAANEVVEPEAAGG